MGVQYDPAVPFWNTLFRCSGSVIPTVVRTPMFIMELLIHLLLLGLDRFVTVEDLSGGGSTNDGGANDEEEDTVEVKVVWWYPLALRLTLWCSGTR